MKKTNKLFGIVSLVAVLAEIAFSPPVQAGIITRTQSPLRKAFARPAPVLKCPLGYTEIAPENSVAPAWLTPNQKLYVEQWEGKTLYHMEEVQCRTSSPCESFVTVKGGYACRLDDLPTDEVCPEGSSLGRSSAGVYQCFGPADLLDDASCLPGFHKEEVVPTPGVYTRNALVCVLDGTTLQEEREKLEQGRFCLDPNSRQVVKSRYRSSHEVSVEIGCAYLSETSSVTP